jgi:hypothetical protein
MANAQRSILFDIIIYAIYLFIVVTAVSFIIGLTKFISCCTGPKNAYEHFQDANEVNMNINNAVISMNATFDSYLQQLDDVMNNTQNMKAQTCSIYKEVHDKFVKSKAAEVPDQAEYQLPKQQQRQLQLTRLKNAETAWINQIQLYQFRHQEKGIIDCSQVLAPPMTEGFQSNPTIAPATLDGLVKNLEGKMNIFSKTLDSPTFASWLNDCVNIEGTAHFLNVYIHNVLINAQLEKCKADYVKGIKDFKNKSADDQQKDTDKANSHCTFIYAPQLESFENVPYVNKDFSYPVPYPSAGLTEVQRGHYLILSVGQDLLKKFPQLVGNKYKDAMAAYKQMNDTNNIYNTYNKQINSVQESNYNQNQAKALNS